MGGRYAKQVKRIDCDRPLVVDQACDASMAKRD